jgi:hypothetical protein
MPEERTVTFAWVETNSVWFQPSHDFFSNVVGCVNDIIRSNWLRPYFFLSKQKPPNRIIDVTALNNGNNRTLPVGLENHL